MFIVFWQTVRIFNNRDLKMKTITRSDVADKVYEQIGLSRKDSGEILDMVIDEIRNELKKGNNVKLSSFGTFLLRHKKPRIGRNPKTGVQAQIKERTVISFKPSQNLRRAINL